MKQIKPIKPNKPDYIKGRGAQINTPNPFHEYHSSLNGLQWFDDDEIDRFKTTEYLETHPKTILNKVDSPDIGMSYSMNPYQGCEHGCIYCYARNTHTFWGYSAGIEFEQKILVKRNAAELLDQKLSGKTWHPHPIMLSGNTDCYQPAEKQHRITREILEVLWKYRHPVGIITKSGLILRDLDILTKMAENQLVNVSISITTLDDRLRQLLEPRTASANKRIDTVTKLTAAGVPVNIMFAPIIPSINDMEVFDVAEKTAAAGARTFNYTVVRLNGDVAEIFKDWLHKNFPDKAERVLHQIESCHGGKLNDSRFGTRMSGEGNFADMIKQQIIHARKKYFKEVPSFVYNKELYYKFRDRQMTLF